MLSVYLFVGVIVLSSVFTGYLGIRAVGNRNKLIIRDLDNGVFPDIDCKSDVEQVLSSVVRQYGIPHTVVKSTSYGLRVELYWNRSIHEDNQIHNGSIIEPEP